MDTSKKYIEMCKKAEEIQRQKSWIDAEPKDFWEPSEISEFVWLPRQDQLQEMMPYWFHGTLEQEFFAFVFHLASTEWEDLVTYYRQFKSWEQLWLAFLMREKYNKIWKEDTWKDEAN